MTECWILAKALLVFFSLFFFGGGREGATNEMIRCFLFSFSSFLWCINLTFAEPFLNLCIEGYVIMVDDFFDVIA